MADDDYGCCALDDARGSGHDGPCEWICADCKGTGRCPECEGDGGIESCSPCDGCDGGGACPGGCYEGRVTEDVMQ